MWRGNTGEVGSVSRRSLAGWSRGAECSEVTCGRAVREDDAFDAEDDDGSAFFSLGVAWPLAAEA